jgi:hypothetical protein
MTRLALAFFLLIPATATAEPVHADAEVDPTAYVLSGYSLHVGLGYQRLRLDLGNFALAVPRAIHGNDAFDIGFDGFGAKLQWFPLAEQRRLVVGVDAAVAHVRVARRDTELAVSDGQLQAGVDVGYRFAIAHGIYVTPWLGIGHAFGARTVMLGGATYVPQRTLVFPAIHLGVAFR